MAQLQACEPRTRASAGVSCDGNLRARCSPSPASVDCWTALGCCDRKVLLQVLEKSSVAFSTP
jgi:hypothetical protein